mgnify:CR=1 FL=1
MNAKFSPSLIKTTIILTSQWESSVFTERRKVKFHETLVSVLHLFQTYVGEMAKQVELSILCVDHECPFEVNIGENF